MYSQGCEVFKSAFNFCNQGWLEPELTGTRASCSDMHNYANHLILYKNYFVNIIMMFMLVKQSYHIAGNFRGKTFTWFCSYLRKFSLQNFSRRLHSISLKMVLIPLIKQNFPITVRLKELYHTNLMLHRYTNGKLVRCDSDWLMCNANIDSDMSHFTRCTLSAVLVPCAGVYYW